MVGRECVCGGGGGDGMVGGECMRWEGRRDECVCVCECYMNVY